MSRLVMAAGLFAASLLASTQADAWTFRDNTTWITDRTIPFQLKKGPSVTDGTITYVFSVNVFATQSGSVARGFKSVDDRRCSISVSTVVEREVCFETLLGEQSCRNKFTGPMSDSAFFKSYQDSLLFFDPCFRFNKDMEKLKVDGIKKLTSQVQTLVNKDSRAIKVEWANTGATVKFAN